jgi:Domain of unknown function (DUF3597)
MSVFGSIMSKIFSHPAAAQPAPEGGEQPATSGAGQPAPSAAGSVGQGQPAAQAGDTAGAQQTVDVAAVLTDMASKNPQQLNWRQSIVDLMKLLGLDSSLEARKQLASELHYTGDTTDSASMNVWLRRQVMQKLAENGGKVPADLKS